MMKKNFELDRILGLLPKGTEGRDCFGTFSTKTRYNCKDNVKMDSICAICEEHTVDIECD